MSQDCRQGCQLNPGLDSAVHPRFLQADLPRDDSSRCWYTTEHQEADQSELVKRIKSLEEGRILVGDWLQAAHQPFLPRGL